MEDSHDGRMSKVAVIIPARYGSTRFPGKPLFEIAGKPLVRHVWERVSHARGVDLVIVATDDLRIAEVAFGFGAEVALTSPRCKTGTDRCAEVASRLKGYRSVINVQGDEPLIDPALVGKLAGELRKDRSIRMITAATPMELAEVENPNVVKVVTARSGDALYFSRSPIPYDRDGAGHVPLRHLGIYGYDVKFLMQFVKWREGALERLEKLEQLRALENGVAIRVVKTRHQAVGVDTPADAELVERILAQKG
jgi:3-deoxy-manno-octulosonate cytidylyltransferase (CMP-KDO synthetase)